MPGSFTSGISARRAQRKRKPPSRLIRVRAGSRCQIAIASDGIEGWEQPEKKSRARGGLTHMDGHLRALSHERFPRISLQWTQVNEGFLDCGVLTVFRQSGRIHNFPVEQSHYLFGRSR